MKFISKFDLANLNSGTKQTAFLINAYNILVIKSVLDNCPLKSVKEL